MGCKEIPRIGQGTWPITDREECIQMIHDGLEIGYRHIDTAQMYGNEAHIGDAIESSPVPRDEIFVATKLDGSNLGAGDVLDATIESAERLGVSTIDLLYIHFPRREYDPETTLPQLDATVDRGLADKIGLSNFTPEYLGEALDILDHDIYAHQAEMHPLLHQRELRQYAEADGHRFVAHTPLARGEVFDIPLLSEIASEYDISEAELSIAWLLSKDSVSAIPKSTDPAHLEDNYRAQSLDIDDEALQRIDSLHEYRQQRVNNPANPAWKWQVSN